MTVWGIDTIASLRAADGTSVPVDQASVAGWLAPGDYGGGHFNNIASDTTSGDDGGTIIVDSIGRRWHRAMRQGCLDPLWFGGSLTVDYSTTMGWLLATVSKMAAAGLPGARIEFPAGVFNIYSPALFTYPATLGFRLSLVGAGQDATTLVFPASDGFTFNMSSPQHTIYFSDMTIASGSAGGFNAIVCNQSVPQQMFGQSGFDRLTFRGTDAATLGNYWSNEIILNGLGNVNFDSDLFFGHPIDDNNCAGTGVILSGAAGGYGLVYNFNKCSWWEMANSVIYGDHVQGVTMTACNHTNVVNGIYQWASAADGAQLAISSSQFACFGNGIIQAGALTNLQANNNLFLLVRNGSSGIALVGTTAEHTICGNVFGGMDGVTGACGINFATGTHHTGTIDGNSLSNMAVAVNLTAATGFYGANAYAGNGTNVYDPHSANHVG